MTREEAKREILFAKREVMADSWIDKAYDVAINALEEPERKAGRWIVIPAPDDLHCGLVKCPFCGELLIGEPNEYNFCSNCGADMRGGK